MSKSIQFRTKEKEKVYPHPYYPIGSIYLSINNTNPSSWFGGVWEEIAQGKCLVGVDINDEDFNTPKKVGGSKYLQEHTHLLTRNGNHSNHILVDTGRSAQWGAPIQNNTGYTAQPMSVTVDNAGKGDSQNLQPYFTCYIWCRTA